jgi:radical SAM protein with 4Fe4S-binding SPASM domain
MKVRDFPSWIILEITNKCNLSCNHCYLSSSYKGINVSLKYIKKIKEEIKKKNIEVIAISGGEPLTHPSFKKIVSLLLPHTKKLIIESNLLLLKKRLINFLEKIKENIIIQTSIESIRGESGRGINLEILKNKLRLLKDKGIKTSILITPLNFNQKDFDIMVSNLKEFTDFLSIERLIPIGRGKNLNELNKISFFRIIKYCENYNINCNDPLISLIKTRENNFIGCSAGMFACCIGYDLNLYPCPKLRVPCGSLKKNSIKYIWNNSPILKKLRNRRKYMKGKCSSCEIINSCGGCRAYAYSKFKDIFNEDPLCWKASNNYSVLAQYYDKLTNYMDYKTKAKKIKELFKKYNVKSVIDLGCGTGNFTTLLQRFGFDCTGVDISKEMIEIAKSKNKNIPWILGDITKIKFKKKFDAAICLFDTLNHLTKKRELSIFFKNVSALLKKNGILLFDINTKKKKYFIKDNPKEKILLENGKKIIKLNSLSGNMWISKFIFEDKSRPIVEIYKERLYSIKEIKELLKKNNFEILSIYDGWEFKDKASSKSKRAMFLVKNNKKIKNKPS